MKKATRFLVSLMLLLLIIASIIWYLFIYDGPSPGTPC